jgi:hypothetical protein
MNLSPTTAPIAYSGPATVYVGDIDEVDASTLYTATSGVVRIPVELSGGDFIKKLPSGTLKPDSIVSIVIDQSGFVLDSNIERASGLTMTAVRSDGLDLSFAQPGLGSGSGKGARTGSSGGSVTGETWSAERSYVVVAPLRSTTFPSGDVTLKGGIDLPHRIPGDTEHRAVNYETALEDNLVNPFWFYRQTVPLKTWDPPTSALAKFGADKTSIPSRAVVAVTGAWTATTSPNAKVREVDLVGDRHFFESASYVYRGVELGYWFKDEFCRGFGSCDIAGLFGGDPYSRDTKISNMMRAVNIPALDGGIGALAGTILGSGGPAIRTGATAAPAFMMR